MPNLKLTLTYDGTEYHGWQAQPGVPTIQGELESVLSRILDRPVVTSGSGRTDAGVHAVAQVVNCHTERRMDLPLLRRGLNALLPSDIRVASIEEVDPDFDARRSARAKTYEYHLWRTPVVPPFRSRYLHAWWQPLDAGAVDAATARFPGVHDFTSFSATAAQVDSRVREVYAANWRRDPEKWVFSIRANGFLQYMVRTIVGTLIEVGRSRIAPESIDAIFAARDRRSAGPTAPAKGLHLVSVEY